MYATATMLQLLEDNVKLKNDNAILEKLARSFLTMSSTLANNNVILKDLIIELLKAEDVPEELRNNCENILKM